MPPGQRVNPNDLAYNAFEGRNRKHDIACRLSPINGTVKGWNNFARSVVQDSIELEGKFSKDYRDSGRDNTFVDGGQLRREQGGELGSQGAKPELGYILEGRVQQAHV